MNMGGVIFLNTEHSTPSEHSASVDESVESEISSPVRGEVWRVDFNPTKGAEIKKIRPAVVLSSDAIGKLPIKLVAPITEWNDAFESNLWHVRIEPDNLNGLSKTSAVDALQIRGVDVSRFVERKGIISATDLEEIITAIAITVEYQ